MIWEGAQIRPIRRLRDCAHCRSWTNADYDGHELTVNCRQGDHNLIDVLQLLEHEGTNIGHLSSRQPTLNDVFLELTGTALRD